MVKAIKDENVLRALAEIASHRAFEVDLADGTTRGAIIVGAKKDPANSGSVLVELRLHMPPAGDYPLNDIAEEPVSGRLNLATGLFTPI